MVRCDGHAYTFGPLLAECHPHVYRDNCHAQYYWMIDGAHPNKLRTPIIPGFKLVKVWEPDPDRRHPGMSTSAADLADTFVVKPEVCSNIDEVTEDIDAVFINNCNGDGSDHLTLATPFLKKGIPTFIDKPFAAQLKDAKAMVALARKHKTPLFSGSIMSHVNEVTYLKRRLPEIRGPLHLGIVKGVGGPDGPLGAIIHGLSFAHTVFGTGVEWVECMGDLPLQYVLLHYASGVEALVVNSHQFEHIRCDVYSRAGHNPPLPQHLQANPMGDHEFIEGALNMLRLFRRMIRTRKPPVPYETLLELIAVVEAGRLAQKKRRRVYLQEVTE